jgi:hypothetical protein
MIVPPPDNNYLRQNVNLNKERTTSKIPQRYQVPENYSLERGAWQGQQ